MQKILSVTVALAALLVSGTGAFAADANRTVRQIQFAKGSSAATVNGRITGNHYIDYQLRAGAGQKIKVSMQIKNLSNYFNVLPPGSQDTAMFTDGAGEKAFDGVLPDDGTYTIRVYLVRAAARRNETGDHTLSVAITGLPLAPLSAKADALVPGTRYHAKSTVKCELQYTKTRECEAGVVRRGTDGTATVELRWDKTGVRRILFVKGKAEAADVQQAMAATRNERGWEVKFGSDERFEIPESLVMGG